MYMMRGYYEKYIMNSYKSVTKKQPILILKMGRIAEQTFFQKRQTDGQWVYEKRFNITNHQGKANQNHNELSPHTCQNGYHQKVEKYREEDMELRDIHTLLVAMQINIAAVENCKSFLKN